MSDQVSVPPYPSPFASGGVVYRTESPDDDRIPAVLTTCLAYAQRLVPAGPVPARLEVGTITNDLLARASVPGTSAWVPPELNGVVAILGLPIVPCEDLDALGWRLLDADGEVIDSGMLP